MRKMKELLKKVFSLVIVTALIVTGVPTVAVYADTTVEEQEVLSDVTIGENSNETITLDETVEKEEVLEGATAEQSQTMPGEDRMPSTGEVKVLVFLVDFPDMKQTDGTTAESRKAELFDLDDVNSFSGFYNASSYGQLKLDGDVYGYYTVEHEYSYYKDVLGRQELINEVLDYYDDVIDYSDYDADKDGILDAVYFEYAGDMVGTSSFWWNYVTWWSEGACEVTDIDEMTLNHYCWLSGENGNLLDVYKHETGHMLGLMDYYDTSSGSSDGALGTFDMMCANDADHNAYSKILLGWIEPIEVSDVAELELRSSQLYPDAAILYPKKDTTSDEFFVIEFITGDAANSRKQYYIKDGGIRVWRVNAHKSETSGGYIYRNIEGAIHFLEAVGICNNADSFENYRQWDDVGGERTSNIFFEGDELTPYSSISSYIHGERETDMSPLESATGPFENSGIIMNNIQIEDGKAKVKISYDLNPREDFEYSIEYIFENMLLAEVTFDYETTLLDASKISVSNGEKNLDIEVELNLVPDYGYKKLYIFSNSKELTETGTFTLRIEEGALVNLFGKTNPVITEELEANSIETSLEKEYEVSTGGNSTKIITVDDTGYVFFEKDDAIWLSQIHQGENGIETNEVKVLDWANNPYIYADKVGDVLVLLVYEWCEENFKTCLYTISLDGDGRLLYEIECRNSPQMFGLGDNCLVDDRTGTLRLIDVSSGEIEKIIESIEWELDAIWKLREDLYMADYENRLVIVDSQFNIVQEISKEILGLGKAEYIVDFIEKNGTMVMISTESNGVDADWSLTYLDERFTAVSKRKFLNDSLFGVPYGGADVIEYEDGYAIQMKLTSSVMMRFVSLFKKAYDVVDICKLAFFDEDMNYVSSKILWETNSSKISVGKIGDKWGYLNLSNDTSAQWYALGQVELENTECEIENVSLNRNDVTLSVGKSYRLREMYEPYDILVETSWSSSDESIVVVDANGEITAISGGTANITVTINGVSSCCIVEVEETLVTNITLNKTKLELVEKETETLTATVLPENADNKAVTWESSDTSVAIVSENGTVIAVGAGTATITAIAKDGSGISASCSVTVEPIKVTTITLNKEYLELQLGATYSLIATITPEDATKNVRWASSNVGVAIVDENGVVTVKGLGYATITATLEKDGTSASCQIYVAPVGVEGVYLNKNKVDLEIGESFGLIATIEPENASNKEVTWTSSDETIAIVDENGKITAIGEGTAIITVASVQNTGMTTICVVNVTLERMFNVSTAEVSKVENQTYTGGAITPNVTIRCGDTTLVKDTDYIVSYSNNVNVGTATVTITGKGNYSGTKEVTFTIVSKSLANATVLSIANQSYTGSAITPSVTVKDGDTTLVKDTDYTVSYSNNVNAGTATVIIIGKGNYSGTKEVTFTIVSKSIANATVSDITNQTYTGSAITPSVTVKGGDTTLVKDTDYTISYSNNVNTGTATVTITGKGNYSGTKEVTFTITEKSLANVTVLEIANQTYTGSAITPSITVKDGDTTLVKDTDYTVSYSNNVNEGTATVTITGKGNYSGTKEVTFTIVSKSLVNATVSDITNQSYTGSAIIPSVTVKDGDTILVKDTDYTVSYSNNLNVGTATVTIIGKGNYSGTKEVTFTIVSKSLANVAVSSIANQIYTGSAITSSVTVKDGDTTLVKDIDYTVSYSNNVNVGTATVTITGKGNYSGTKEVTFTIVSKSLANATVSSIVNQTYTGSAITPSITVTDGNKTLVKDTDYTVSYSNNVNTGTATVTITGKGNYSGTKEVTFTIVSKSLANATVSSITNQTYTGIAITPSVTVKDGDTTLVKDTDYTVSYSNNVNVGTATVTIIGKGNYSGTKEVTFTIVSKSLANATVSSIANQTYTGSAITPSVTVKDGSKTLVKDTDYTVSYSNNVNAGTATVTITGKGNYTGTRTLNFTIVKKEEPKPQVPTQITSPSVSVNQSAGSISKITIGTSVQSFRASLNENNYVKVYQNSQVVSDSSVLATGMEARVMDGNTVVKKYSIIVTGDTNGDGKMNITDMIAIKANILKKTLLNGVYEDAGDVNGDGKINVTDFIKIKATLLKKDSIVGVAVK